MHAVLASTGTDGDINPYVALGALLRSRGHRATLVVNESFRARSAERGLDFRALVSDEEMAELLEAPDFWHPTRAAPLVARWGVRFMRRQYALLTELARSDDVVFVASPAVLAARLVQEKLDRPLASVLLQPWIIPSAIEPPAMAGVPLPRWAPGFVHALFWLGVDGIGHVLFGRELNRFRGELGLPPTGRVFRWFLSPQRVIGMFPEWYGPPQPDWPPQIRLAGFPLCDGGSGAPLAAEVREFCVSGDAPVAFSFGSGMMHAAGVFREGLAACERLGRRAIVLTRYPDQLPQPLPPFARHCAFAPFAELLPLCAALVHHGGVGTTARALAAGVPQLALSFAYDQEDNGRRVVRLGAGEWIVARRARAARIAGALSRLLTPGARARCEALRPRAANDTALETAAGWIEELARSRE